MNSADASMLALQSSRIKSRRYGPRGSDESSRSANRFDERNLERNSHAQVSFSLTHLTLRFMAWERSFQKRVNTIREREIASQARNYQIEVAFSIIWELTPVLVTVVAFLVSRD